ncbi:rCG24276, partial [Rattus norvegicus]
MFPLCSVLGVIQSFSKSHTGGCAYAVCKPITGLLLYRRDLRIGGGWNQMDTNGIIL